MTKKLKIGVDVDETIVHTGEAWYEWLVRSLGEPERSAKPYPYNVASLFEDRFLTQFIDPYGYFEHVDYSALRPVEGAKENIDRLHSLGHEIIFVTHVLKTKVNHLASKCEYLEKTFPYASVVVTEDKQCVDLDVLVDDNPEYLNKVHCERIWFNQGGYIHKTEVHKPHRKASSWRVVERLIAHQANKETHVSMSKKLDLSGQK